MLEAELRDRQRSRLLDFTKVTYPKYKANWHHRRLCEFLDKLRSGEIQRGLVFMPPRHGKSELFSRRLPALALGVNPDERIIAASYSDDLATRMNRDVQRIIDGEAYRSLFPDTKLMGRGMTGEHGRWVRQSDFWEVVGRQGSYRSAGIGGGITGMGFTLGLIDDPIKNAKEAASPTIREAQWEWYGTAFMTRMEEGARIGMTLTRWHEDDLAGRQLELVKNGVATIDWHVLSLPAINETGTTDVDPRTIGEALWPDRYGLTFLEELRVNLGSQAFAALYQQRPAPAEGGLVKRVWFAKRYKEVPAGARYMLSVDLSFDDGPDTSFVVMQVWAWKGADVFLVDQVRRRMDFVQTLATFQEMTRLYPQATMKLVEKKANGSALISMLKTKVQGIIAVNPRGSKLERLAAVSPLMEAGNVWLPEFSAKPWVGEFIEELVTFPNAPNDDQVDACSQALNRLRGETAAAVGPSGIERVAPIPR